MTRNRVASEAFTRALREARARALSMGRVAMGGIDADLFQTAEAIYRLGDEGIITEETAARLLEQIRDVFDQLSTNVSDRVKAGEYAVFREVGQQHARALATVGIQLELGAFNAEAYRIVANIRNDVGLKSLMNRHIGDATKDVRAIVRAGVADGSSARDVAKTIAEIIRNRGGDISAPGLASVEYDAMRIARSETMNALRAATGVAGERTGIIAAYKWQLSGAHPVEDECDEIAAEDVGFGPGFYPPEDFPEAPHPFCGCYAGDVQLKDVSEWPDTVDGAVDGEAA